MIITPAKDWTDGKMNLQDKYKLSDGKQLSQDRHVITRGYITLKDRISNFMEAGFNLSEFREQNYTYDEIDDALSEMPDEMDEIELSMSAERLRKKAARERRRLENAETEKKKREAQSGKMGKGKTDQRKEEVQEDTGEQGSSALVRGQTRQKDNAPMAKKEVLEQL